MASAKAEYLPKTITSLQIQVDNDFDPTDAKIADNNNGEDDEEMEEGEASEDEVEVNVIVGKTQDVSDDELDSYGPELPVRLSHRSKSSKNWKDHSRIFSSVLRSKEEKEEFIDFNYQKADEEILDERASRFGLGSSDTYVSRNELLNLYKSLDVDEDDFHRGGWRSDAIHMRGIEGLNTEDIFEYFRSYAPNSVEWLNKNSCNITWIKKGCAARALLGLSCPIRSISKRNKSATEERKAKELERKENSKAVHKPPTKLKSEQTKKKKLSKSCTESSSSSDSSSSDSEDESSSGTSSSDSSSSSNSSSDSSSSDSSSSDSSSDNEAEKMEVEESTKSHSLPNPSKLPTTSSKPQPVLDTPIEDESVSAEDISVPVPSGRWRLGVPFAYTKAIFLRFAHCKDKKMPGLKKPVIYKEYLPDTADRKSTKSIVLFKPSDLSDLTPRLRGAAAQAAPPPLPPHKRSLPPEFSDFDSPPPGSKGYQDLDDPFDDGKNPWGFLAQNWGRKETQDSLDYQALLRQHITGNKRKHKPSDSEDEAYGSQPQKMFSRGRFQEVSEEEYDCDDVRVSDGSDDVVPWKSKISLPRMRMYADAEEKRKTVRRRKPMSRDLHKRIGARAPSRFGGGGDARNFDLRVKLQRRKGTRIARSDGD